jgi:hypothetical protein
MKTQVLYLGKVQQTGRGLSTAASHETIKFKKLGVFSKIKKINKKEDRSKSQIGAGLLSDKQFFSNAN